ncbi:hypothetical protein [Spirosoma validum]|uniref:Uncharacterized protein n=1 Tax=Spirosoma validum TaxID=2771355 RepID=A0A927B3T6_9BACT|nr:hypothetical protein [Spirosoma validum]MBD2754873.1 hypothetical protein [Spirosoma validum]
MKKQLLFCAFVGLMTSCQQEDAIQPSSPTLAGEAVGTYQTNVYLDPAYVATASSELPYAELKAESANSVTLIYSKLYPVKSSHSIEHVTLLREPNGIQLSAAGSVIGTLQTDRVFTSNGMEKQGQLLRISMQNDSANGLYFIGSK